jgi:shikimate kinase
LTTNLPLVESARPGLYFLVGFMGVGKTTLGREVAKRLAVPFVDLDERIAAEAGAGIPELFEREGESGFRERESRELRRVVDETPSGIVATGGGAFTIDENRELIAKSGVSVWLDVPLEALLSRVETNERPLWTAAGEVRALAERRRAYYREADFRLDLDNFTPQRGADELYRLLTEHVARTS